MRTTIDKAGRVVIPAAIRERAGLLAGSELEVTEDELGIRLERVAMGPVIDIAALIEDERNRWP
jgi:AbrB family looped-hinge helix DNA binding protein